MILARRPDVCLIDIGHEEAALGAAVADGGTAFLQKPFAAESLLRAVRDALGPPG